ncbi:Extracellular membrane protein, 8-cysteine region, CFEM [Cordyceps javanica]|uniref:Extracellular membrane protein, 8-cysteine region, CFEM n=1 Tax=Cordyceps javanica TaxID=43265 RepID=A0A545UP45_9HYPO|nr:Extracellular membrane protein, 8-cysteine region, CFEM [Cordyceps javanica]TQW02979.1 Extracellular membrane protein, 8-cysteine region, CFEM [Cordyceps javanica]
MRLLDGISAVLAASALPFAHAQQSSSGLSLTDAITQMPSCALSCLLKVVGEVGCDPLDKTCICKTNFHKIEEVASPCILKACTFTDAMKARNLTALSCDAPVRDKTMRYNVMAIVLGVITNLLVVIRLIFKRFFSYRQSLGWDDYTIIGAMLLGIPATIINVLGLTANGMGRDVWTLTTDEVNRFGAFFYTMEVLYLAEIACIKLSLSVFYLYIFPGEWTRRLLWATVVFNVASGVAFVVAGVVQCIPIPFFWKKYTDPMAAGHCIDINTFGWTHAAVSIAVDVWLIAIPLSQLRKLQLHWKKKIGVTLMFLLGTFVTVVSILRLQSLIYLARSFNPTWDQWVVAWWSTIEVHVGMICASLPTLRLVLVRMWPRVFSTTVSRSKSVTERNTRPNSSSYIMQSKEITMSSIEIELGATSSPEIRPTPPPKNNFSQSPRPFVPPKDW